MMEQERPSRGALSFSLPVRHLSAGEQIPDSIELPVKRNHAVKGPFVVHIISAFAAEGREPPPLRDADDPFECFAGSSHIAGNNKDPVRFILPEGLLRKKTAWRSAVTSAV